ncbi:hypothetical protein Tco_0787535 [Tanacetum coccineum]
MIDFLLSNVIAHACCRSSKKCALSIGARGVLYKDELVREEVFRQLGDKPHYCVCYHHQTSASLHPKIIAVHDRSLKTSKAAHIKISDDDEVPEEDPDYSASADGRHDEQGVLSSPVPVLSPSPPASPIRPLGYRAAMIRLRAEAASTSHSLPLPPPIILSHTRPDAPSSGTPPMHLLSTDRRADRPEVTLPPRKRLGIALGPRYEVGESSSAAAARPAGGLRADYGFVATMDREIRRDLERDVGYGITDSWDEIVETMQGAPASADTELGRHMTEFETRVRQDTDEIYTRLDDEQTERQLLAGRLNMLFRDRRAHARTARLMEAEARMSREAWGRSMDASDLARAEVMSLRTTVLAQQSEIRELQSADRRRQTMIIELLAADYKRQRQLTKALKLLKGLQNQMA